MESKILESVNFIEIYANLKDFAEYHQNLGGQKAHKLIKALWDKRRSQIIHATDIDIAERNGYDQACEQILELLYKTFVP